jgi:hypothetical protein
MSSEKVSLISTHPFVRKFVWAILQNIQAEHYVRGEKYVVHADLVPKVSERVMKKSMEIPKPVVPKVLPSKPIVPKVPAQKVMPSRAPPVRRAVPQKIAMPHPPIAPPPIKGDAGLSQDYGKVTPLLNDPSVSTIECQGSGRPVMVIRAGQRQITRINLSAKEVKEFLEKISDAVHIPILEGVFRAAVDNFAINAVVSEIIGSRFVIKKANAFSMMR